MNNKKKAAFLLALTVGAGALTGCNTIIGSKIPNAIESEIGIDDIKQLKDIMKACETMATVKDSEVKEVCNQIEESIRKADSENYTSWTDPEGELHSSYYRDRQDILDIIDILSKNTWDKNEDGKYIVLEDVPNNKFIGYNDELIIGDYKNSLLGMTENSINSLLGKYDAKFRVSCPHNFDFGVDPMDPESLALLGVGCSVLNTKYEPDFQAYVNLSETGKKIYRESDKLVECIAKADTVDELVRAAINALALDRAARDEDFRTVILDQNSTKISINDSGIDIGDF